MLLIEITPAVVPGAGFEENMSRCREILDYFEDAQQYKVVAAVSVLKWNRAHRSSKYASKDDKKLYIRSANQYIKALRSDTASLINEYALHEFAHLEVCKAHSMSHFSEEIDKLEREAQQRADEEKERAERERIAKLCPLCRSNEPGEMMYGSVRICNSCYDEKYEDQQRSTRSHGYNLKPRPGYVPPKFDVCPASLEDREYVENKAWFLQNGKDGEWAFGREEQAALGVGVPHIAAVFRYMRKGEMAVTSDEFIELLLECAGKKAVEVGAGHAPEGAQ